MRIDRVAISALAYGGEAVGRLPDGRVCFVRGALPGEVVSLHVTAEKRRFVRGEAEEIVSASPHRFAPRCPLAGRCPGCAFQHADYPLELFWKDRQLRDFLLRGGIADADVFAPPFAAPEVFGSRNKVTLHRGDGGYGYFGMDNRTVIPVAACPLARREINGILSLAEGERALFRFTEKEGAMLIPSSGKVPLLHEYLPGAGEFAVRGDGFFQTDIPVAAELVREVVHEILSCGGREVLELYCGVGVFSVAAASAGGGIRFTGVELDRAAVGCAAENASAHGVGGRCSFIAADSGRVFARIRRRPDTILLDPPRSGLSPETMAGVIASGAEHILCISCAADTLTRDLHALTAAGYRVIRVRMLDMFPRTAHFETLTVLRRG